MCLAVKHALGTIASSAAHKNIFLAHHLYQLYTLRLYTLLSALTLYTLLSLPASPRFLSSKPSRHKLY